MGHTATLDNVSQGYYETKWDGYQALSHLNGGTFPLHFHTTPSGIELYCDSTGKIIAVIPDTSLSEVKERVD